METYEDYSKHRIKRAIANTPGAVEHVRNERRYAEGKLAGINTARRIVPKSKPTKQKTTNLPGYFYRTKTNQKKIERGLFGGFYGNS